MDKLEPLIKHRFWIIFGLTLPIILIAYFMASGKMAAATAAQEAKLDSTLSGVPKGTSEPNQTYAAEASLINEQLQARVDEQVQLLWESQIDRITWPKVIVDYIPNEYRGEIDPDACYTYMRGYPTVLERLWKRVQPYVGDPRTNPALATLDVDWPQKVLIDGHAIPHETFNMSLPAESPDIWDAQEDIWLLELIFDAVVRTNEDAAYISEAPVRQIDEIRLVGGSGQSTITAAAGDAAGGGYGGDSYGGEGYGDEESYGDEYGGASGFAAMGFGRMAGGAGAPAAVAFNVAEEFGAPQPAETDETETASASTDSYGGESYGGEEYGDEYGGGYGGGMGGFGMGPGVKMKRYIGESSLEEGPYRERGFYMSVLVLQDRIPDFLSELSSSPWPIRIGRFHIGPNPYASRTPAANSVFGGPMAMAMGGSYGDDYGDSYGGEGGEEYGGSYGGAGGFGAMGFGAMGGGFGNYGMGGGGTTPLALPAYMRMPTSIDPGLRGDPNLVKMDFCGIITMYNPQTDDSVEAVDDGSTEEDFTEALEASPATPEEAAAMAEEAAAQAAAAGPDGVNPAGATPGAPGAEPVPADQPATGGTPPQPDPAASGSPGAATPIEAPTPGASDAPGQ